MSRKTLHRHFDTERAEHSPAGHFRNAVAEAVAAHFPFAGLGGSVKPTPEQIEAQRAAVEITEEVHAYTLRGNPEAKTTLPASYVPTVFEEDAAMWERINAELKGAE